MSKRITRRHKRPFSGILHQLPSEQIVETDYEEPISDENLLPEPKPYKNIEKVLPKLDTFTTVNIGNGVQIKTTTKLSEEMKIVTAETWTKEKRNSSLQIRNIIEGMEFVSPDIYQIKIKKNSTGIWNSSEEKLPTNKQCSFSLADEFKNDVTFRIPMNEEIKSDENVFTYSAWIECGQEWKSVEADIKDGYVEFNCHRLNSFGIVRFPKNIKHIIKPSGSKLAVDEGGSLMVEFEPGTVKIEQSITMSMQRPSERYLRHSADPRRLVHAATEKISLSCDNAQLIKQFKLHGTLQSEIEEDSSDFEGDIKLVVYQNNVPVVMDSVPKPKSNNQVVSMMDYHNSAAIVCFKKNYIKNANFNSKLKDEMDLLYGNKIPCHILLFYVKKQDNKMLVFTAECCRSENVDKIEEIHCRKGHSLTFCSKELILPLQQRIRIHPSGCIEYKAGREPHFFLFFMHVANENSVDFSVVVNRRLGTSSNAIIEFAADNQKRGEITRAEFNPDKVDTNQTPRINVSIPLRTNNNK